MATCSSILVWKIPWTEKLVHRGCKESNVTKHTHERSLLRENSHLIFWCFDIFHMWRTAIKFRLSREWSDGEKEIGRALEGWRERRWPVPEHRFCPSLDTWGEVVWQDSEITPKFPIPRYTQLVKSPCLECGQNLWIWQDVSHVRRGF